MGACCESEQGPVNAGLKGPVKQPITQVRELKPQEQLAVDLKSQKTKKEKEDDKKHSRSSSKDSAKNSDKDNQSLKSIVIQTTEQVVTDIPVIETEQPVQVILQEPEKVDEDEAITQPVVDETTTVDASVAAETQKSRKSSISSSDKEQHQLVVKQESDHEDAQAAAYKIDQQVAEQVAEPAEVAQVEV